MKTLYDAVADALYIRFADRPVIDSEEVKPGIVLDFDENGRVVAIEIVDASRHLASGVDLPALSAA